jgi:hypothetical protein
MSIGHSLRAIGQGRPANDKTRSPQSERSSPKSTACTVPVRLGVSLAIITPTIAIDATLGTAGDTPTERRGLSADFASGLVAGFGACLILWSSLARAG